MSTIANVNLTTPLTTWPQAARFIVALYKNGVGGHPDDRGTDLINLRTNALVFPSSDDARAYDTRYEEAFVLADEAGVDLYGVALEAGTKPLVSTLPQVIGSHDGAENDAAELMRDFPGVTVTVTTDNVGKVWSDAHSGLGECVLSGPERIVLDLLANVFGWESDAATQIDHGVPEAVENVITWTANGAVCSCGNDADSDGFEQQGDGVVCLRCGVTGLHSTRPEPVVEPVVEPESVVDGDTYTCVGQDEMGPDGSRQTWMITMTFEVDASVSRHDIDVMVGAAETQIMEPQNGEGDDADFDTHNVVTQVWARS